MASPPRVVIVAGEASADLHAAGLIAELQGLLPDLQVSGIGGPALAARGVEMIYRMEELSVMGFSEVIPKLRFILGALKSMRRHLAESKPDLLVLLDFPDFNFRLAKAARRLGIKVLYYIGPQVWAWRSGRAGKLARLVDRLAVILSFEPEVYRRLAPELPVTFVGHPLLDQPRLSGEGPPALELPDGDELVGLLPGSRHGEIKRMLPLLFEAARLLQADRPGLHFALPLAPGLEDAVLAPYMDQAPGNLHVLEGRAVRVMRQAKVLLITSGTATLEAALVGAPMVVVYRTGGFNYLLGRALIRVDHISLPNLVAGRGVVTELIQGHANARRLAAEASALLEDTELHQRMRHDLARVRENLGGPGAGRRTAQLALELMGRRAGE